jgi:hypothetical protein
VREDAVGSLNFAMLKQFYNEVHLCTLCSPNMYFNTFLVLHTESLSFSIYPIQYIIQTPNAKIILMASNIILRLR